MHLAHLLSTFALVFAAELPDKSAFATLLLGSRYPARYVWLGVASAFVVHTTLAVAAGGLLDLLPHRVLDTVVAALFAIGALLVLRSGADREEGRAVPADASPRRVFGTAFTLIFLGEWGDATQLATANLAARTHDPVFVGMGALLALLTVSALAVTVGRTLLRVVPMHVVRWLSAAVLATLAVFNAVAAVRG